MCTVTPKLLSKEAIEERFDLSQYEVGNLDNERILFYDGDTTITGDLTSDWASAMLATLGEDTSLDTVLIMVNGNLTVKGDIVIGDYHPLLLVLGNVYCDVLQSDNILDTWAGMMDEQDEEFRNRIQFIIANKQQETDGRYSLLITAGMKPEELQDINKLQQLKYLDLSFNDLTALPDTFFQLQQLATIDLRYNKFPVDVQERINQAFPNTT